MYWVIFRDQWGNAIKILKYIIGTGKYLQIATPSIRPTLFWRSIVMERWAKSVVSEPEEKKVACAGTEWKVVWSTDWFQKSNEIQGKWMRLGEIGWGWEHTLIFFWARWAKNWRPKVVGDRRLLCGRESSQWATQCHPAAWIYRSPTCETSYFQVYSFPIYFLNL